MSEPTIWSLKYEDKGTFGAGKLEKWRWSVIGILRPKEFPLNSEFAVIEKSAYDEAVVGRENALKIFTKYQDQKIVIDKLVAALEHCVREHDYCGVVEEALYEHKGEIYYGETLPNKTKTETNNET